MAIINVDDRSFTIDPDELLDIRNHALECAVRAMQGNCSLVADAKIVLAVAKEFEEHLTRKVSNG